MFVIGKRAYGTDRFRWFYHPLLPQNEKEFFHFFVWFGKNWYICWHKNVNNTYRLVKIMEEQEKEPEIEISPLTEEDVKEDPELENRLKKYGYLTDECGR